LRKEELTEDINLPWGERVFVYLQLIDLRAEEVIRAGRYERTTDRQTHRNGTRKRQLETRVGEINVKIPKLRQGSYFPSILEPRKRSEEALLAVVQEAYILGVSTRKMNKLIKAMGLTIIDISKVSWIFKELDFMWPCLLYLDMVPWRLLVLKTCLAPILKIDTQENFIIRQKPLETACRVKIKCY
jgi:hypothetical protein